MCEDLLKEFEKAIGGAPYPHQLETAKMLLEGKSVLLRAPCGSGKTEAAIIPFLLLREIYPHIIYSLPMRALVEDIGRRMREVIKDEVSVHHGANVEDPFFRSRIIVTTLDQTVGAYACTPLSISPRYGNVTSGAVSSAVLCFDEAHTYDPLRGLHTMFILCEHSKELGLPFIIMSATLPESFVEECRKRLGVEIVEAEEESIPARRDRRVMFRMVSERTLDIEAVKKVVEAHGLDKKFLIIVNTVDRAQQLYRKLKELDFEIKLCILHARFLMEDRKRKTDDLVGKMGKFKKDNIAVCLISTQVCEVGLDISCDVLMTEIAPIDSLIQRIGRCARKGGKGIAYVYNVDRFAPYEDTVMKQTLKETQKLNGKIIRWRDELEAVNNVYSEIYRKILLPERTADILSLLSFGSFKGNKITIERSVRYARSCEISIHSSPQSLSDSLIYLRRIPLDIQVLRRFVRSYLPAPKLWHVRWTNESEDTHDFRPVEIRNENEIIPYEFYILHPDHAKYDPDEGLILGEQGCDLQVSGHEKRTSEEKKYYKERWNEHSVKSLQSFWKFFISYRQFTEKVAEKWEIPARKFEACLALAVALHDIGKLNRAWQKIATEGNEPLAHMKSPRGRLPHHACIGAYALRDFLVDSTGHKALGKIFAEAIAHHHVTRAENVPKYQFIDNWSSSVENVIKKIEEKYDMTFSDYRGIIDGMERETVLSESFPSIEDPLTYRTYSLVARLIRISDWDSLKGVP